MKTENRNKLGYWFTVTKDSKDGFIFTSKRGLIQNTGSFPCKLEETTRGRNATVSTFYLKKASDKVQEKGFSVLCFRVEESAFFVKVTYKKREEELITRVEQQLLNVTKAVQNLGVGIVVNGTTITLALSSKSLEFETDTSSVCQLLVTGRLPQKRNTLRAGHTRQQEPGKEEDQHPEEGTTGPLPKETPRVSQAAITAINDALPVYEGCIGSLIAESNRKSWWGGKKAGVIDVKKLLSIVPSLDSRLARDVISDVDSALREKYNRYWGVFEKLNRIAREHEREVVDSRELEKIIEPVQSEKKTT